ncbi:hypothetical protein OWV82_020213 [Melia azedarach]|uniref:Uncharacterized protein n=1 Tax=Melia azedarach TaxID=155640 RepID=A0ACC1X543_MELAZ|nr:hypothetical protein OWV82_020213 [Melia azedarach]
MKQNLSRIHHFRIAMEVPSAIGLNPTIAISGMLKNQFEREMQNLLSRKLQCRCQIEVLGLQISNCRSSSQGKASLFT